ncbi:MAG: hypothetical protein Q4F88_00740 [Eubacteriales bacterium]|nr:hypothetical protein [Eubacteriales bacterium]
MKKNIIKNLIVLIFIIVLFTIPTKAADIRFDLTYGVDNQAKAGKKLPIELIIENREKSPFLGYIEVYMYDKEYSLAQYEYELEMMADSIVYKNISLSIGSNINNLLIQILNDKKELITEEQLNIDVQSLDTDIIIGILSDTPWKLDYFDKVNISNNSIKTKVINLDKRKLQRNLSIFDSLDILLISDYDCSNLAGELERNIFNFIHGGGIVILGTGSDGMEAIPNIFETYLTSPVNTYTKKVNFAINSSLLVPYGDEIELNLTNYDFDGNTIIEEIDGVQLLRNKSIGAGILSNATFSFGDIANYVDSHPEIINDFLSKIIGQTRLYSYQLSAGTRSNNDLETISELINIVESSLLPNMSMVMIICGIYLFINLIAIIIFYTHKYRRHYYIMTMIFTSFIFVIIIIIFFSNSRKQNNFVTFVKTIELTDTSAEEKIMFNIRTPEEGEYKYTTDIGTDINVLIGNINKNISKEDINNTSINKTVISNTNEKNNVIIHSKEPFFSSFMSATKKSVNEQNYNIESSIDIYNNVPSGYIKNNMNYDITDLSLVFFNGIIKIGDLKAGESINIDNFTFIDMPIMNNYQMSEALGDYPNNKIIKHYLDTHITGFYSNAKIMGFIQDNDISTLIDNDLEDIEGITFLSKDANVSRESKNYYESLSLAKEARKINGNYNIVDNTISGDTPVENEYYFNSNRTIEKLFIDNIEMPKDALDYTVPFDGKIYFYNRNTLNYDLIGTNEIKKEQLNDYLSPANSIRVRFEQYSKDMFYRPIYLPTFRVLEKKDEA